MSEKYINSVQVSTSYLISLKTGDAFIDEEYTAYLFFYKDDAVKFAASKTNVTAQMERYRDITELYIKCFASGAQKLKVYRDFNKIQLIQLNNKLVPLGFYNNELCGNLSLFKYTKKKSYLKMMSTATYIVPIRIKNNSAQEITYGIVKKDEDFYYLAFTNKYEYDKWAKKVAGWQPLRVSFDIMCQISKDHGYMINPMGNTVVLPYSLMEQVRE